MGVEKEFLTLIGQYLPRETYLVGGFVRDYLLGREIKDIDLIVRNDAKNCAQLLAKRLKGSYFGFEKNNLPLRGEVYTVLIPFRGKDIRVDISSFERLEEDLAHRDFTINAMAWRLEDFLSNRENLIDPFGGREDLKRRLIRAVSPTSFDEDPLRILRAYRLAQHLDFAVEPSTRRLIVEKAPLLNSVAPERILGEIMEIFSKKGTYKTLKALKEDDIDIYTFVGKITSEPILGVEMFENLQREGFTQHLIKTLSAKKESFLGNYGLVTATKLAVFLHTFPNREEFLKRYPLGEKLKRFLNLSIEGFQVLKTLPTKGVKDLHEYLKRFSPYLYPIGVLAKIYGNYDRFERVIRFYRRWKEYSKPLIGGREIIHLLGIKPSPLVGEILEKLVLAQLEGKVKTKKEAQEFVKNLLYAEKDKGGNPKE